MGKRETIASKSLEFIVKDIKEKLAPVGIVLLGLVSGLGLLFMNLFAFKLFVNKEMKKGKIEYILPFSIMIGLGGFTILVLLGMYWTAGFDENCYDSSDGSHYCFSEDKPIYKGLAQFVIFSNLVCFFVGLAWYFRNYLIRTTEKARKALNREKRKND